MKNMKQDAMNQIKIGTTKVVQSVAIKMGESLLDGRLCIGFVYEPTVPTKLLKNKLENRD